MIRVLSSYCPALTIVRFVSSTRTLMPPSPVLLWMDSGAAPPAAPPPSSSSVMAGPSSVWRLAERRSRKAGSANIFSSVHLWQLQRLFRAAGDQDAEQRAQLVWGRRDEAELAQALVALRARGQRRGLRRGRDALGAHWLRAFNHLRIGESSQSHTGKDPEEPCSESESDLQDPAPDHQNWNCPSPPTDPSERAKERTVRGGPGLRREADPDRYLHRILH